MKKIKTLLLLLLITSVSFAQRPPQGKHKPDKEKVKAMKIAFITEKLALTPEEAQSFWPIYNEYDAKREALRKAMRKGRKNKEEATNLSDEEIAKDIAKQFEIRQQELNLDKTYHQKFIQVLPIKKVGRLYRADHDFKRELLKKIKNHREGGRGQQDGPPPRH